jgi:hypothetical protein
VYEALAVRPAGCQAREAPQVVYAVCRRQGEHYLPTAEIYAAGPEGQPRRLAGTTPFGAMGRLAMDRAGKVLVADNAAGAIRRIGLDGVVTLVAGSRHERAEPPRDGLREAARFGHMAAMVVDPATGDLYVGDEHSIRKVTPAGVVTTPVAWPPRAEREAWEDRLGQGTTMLNGIGDGEVRGLALHGRELFIHVDRDHTLLAFHLDTRRVAVVVPGAGPATRTGPIRLLAPATPPAVAAVLGRNQAAGPLAFSPDGMCLLAQGAGLLQLDLPDGPVTHQAGGPGR